MYILINDDFNVNYNGFFLLLDIIVDGNWGSWTESSECSKSCGGGLQERSRDCDSPTPQFGGVHCLGDSRDVVPCNDFNCPSKH